MPAVLTPPTNNQAADGRDRNGGDNGEVLALPFTRAALELHEPFHDENHTGFGASRISVSPDDIPALGFLRGVWILVEATGGAAGAATVAADEDAPFAVLDAIQIRDVNGTPIYGPVSGYHAYLFQKYGNHRGIVSDPRVWPSFSDVDTDGNFTFLAYIPIEVQLRDALGCLPNLDSSAPYQFEYAVSADSDVYGTSPDTLPDVRVRAWQDVWSQPPGADLRGRPQAQRPPQLGVTQFHRSEVHNIGTGDQTIEIRRTGNLIRTLIAVLRDTTPARSDAGWPDPVRLVLDSRNLDNINRTVLRDRMAHRYDLDGGTLDAARGRDTGVHVWDFSHDSDGHAGGEQRHGYLQTTPASRLEIIGNFTNNADQLTVLIEDLAVPAGA